MGHCLPLCHLRNTIAPYFGVTAPLRRRSTPPRLEKKMCNLFLFSCITPVFIRRARPFSLHLLLIFLVLCYAFFGGLVFNHLEGEAYHLNKQRKWETKVDCVKKVLSSLHTWALYEPWRNHTTNLLTNCFKKKPDERDEWSILTATLYGFGVMTTLGYNRISPSTYAGRMFCIVYGILGIPVTMIIIANIGKYMHKFARTTRRKLDEYRNQKLLRKVGMEEKKTSTQMTSLFLLLVFLLYVAIGALLLPGLNGQIDFINGLYYNFICLTALDFGQLVPTRMTLLPITFLYVSFGLAIATIAIEIGSEYMRKLHYIGAKIKSAATTKIWFGGKSLAVSDLLHSVGKKCGIEAKVIDSLDLDSLVEKTIAINEGKVTEEDVEDQKPSVSPPEEPIPVQSPIYENVYQQSFYEVVQGSLNDPPKIKQVERPLMNYCRIVTLPPVKALEHRDEVNIFMTQGTEFVVVRRPVKAVPLEPRPPSPPEAISVPSAKSLKGFLGQKELTKRDPKKLFETYQAEWNKRKSPAPLSIKKK